MPRWAVFLRHFDTISYSPPTLPSSLSPDRRWERFRSSTTTWSALQRRELSVIYPRCSQPFPLNLHEVARTGLDMLLKVSEPAVWLKPTDLGIRFNRSRLQARCYSLQSCYVADNLSSKTTLRAMHRTFSKRDPRSPPLSARCATPPHVNDLQDVLHILVDGGVEVRRNGTHNVH